MVSVAAPSPSRAAWRLHVTGLVQGVGFRPFVHRLAHRHGLGGWVRNGSGEVEIHVEGPIVELEDFLDDLRKEAPPLARIGHVELAEDVAEGSGVFRILASAHETGRRQPVSADVAICEACLAELHDPGNRRFGHPFITCTDCGPRFTIIRAMPYDRERTSMAAFRQCPACRAEYEEPGNRRFHSETNSCPACGPRLWFSRFPEVPVQGAPDAIAAAAALIARGGIVAIRGLGGFQLAVDATDETAVLRLRRRKRRESKPFAVMVRTLEDARALGAVEDAEASLLESPARPIVLLTRREGAPLAPSVAPRLAVVGVMLATSALHHLLLEACARPLVMTSGNLTDEPIAIGNDEALDRLRGVADGFLLHDREILARYDDSVARVVGQRPVHLRRARGYAPMPLRLPVPTPRPLVAVGPHLKNTFTLAVGVEAYPSQHIGDLESFETLEHFRASLTAFRSLFRVEPEVAVRDAHAGYLSTRVAHELGLDRTIVVQHHHAHVAAVAAEHGVTAPVLGVAMDGTGAGDDGTVWGAEILAADLTNYRRVGHLLPAPMPGGDLASRTPWRAALGFLASGEGPAGDAEPLWLRGVDPLEVEVARRQLARRLNAPLASSMGRLFDAAAAIIGVRRTASYEGQAAMELEALAGRRPAREVPSRFIDLDGRLVLDPVPLLVWLEARARRGEDVADLAADFHASIAWATAHLVRVLAEQEGLDTIALGGGTFQNARFTESLVTRLQYAGLRVLQARELPPNDGAISFGQAAIGAARLAAQPV